MPCPEPVHGFLKRRLTRHGNARSGKRLLDQGRVAPDEGDGASRAFQGFDQRREILPLAVSAENDEDAAALSCEALIVMILLKLRIWLLFSVVGTILFQMFL